MPNNKDWQRRSDEWVRSMHKSRLHKEKCLTEKRIAKDTQKVAIDASAIKRESHLYLPPL